MIVESSEGWDDTEEEEELMPDLLAWAGSVRLMEYEASLIRNLILENVTGNRKCWLERTSARIDRTLARSRRRIDQAGALRLQLQSDRIVRRLNTGRMV